MKIRSTVVSLLLLTGVFVGPADADLEVIKAQARKLDARAKELTEAAEGAKQQVATLAEKTKQKLSQLKELASNKQKLQAETLRRLDLLQANEEAKQLAGLKDADQLGDEGLILAAYAAKESKHTAVRRQALSQALSAREDGFAPVAFSFDSLPVEDRVYVVELAAKDTANTTILYAAASSKDVEIRQVLIKAAANAAGQQGLLLLSAALKDADVKLAPALAEASKSFNSEDELFILYMAAKSNESAFQIAALKAAAARTVQKESGLVCALIAFPATDPQVRAEVVRTLKKIGGADAQFALDTALRDPDEKLRQAAEKAVKEADEKQ